MERIRRFFRRFGKGLKAKGYTLIEVAAVVAVTGTLAAVAMPVVVDKIAAGKLVGAQNDVNALKNAILNFMKDTGVPPFYKDPTSATGLTLPKTNDSTYFYSLVTVDGTDPKMGENPAGAQVADWNLPTLDSTPKASVDAQLNDNTPGYPTKGISAWKGPYLPSVANLIRKDPWGNKYLVAITGLTESDDTTKVQRGVFVLSAGPNGLVETNADQIVKYIEAATGQVPAGFKLGGDDIISRIQ